MSEAIKSWGGGGANGAAKLGGASGGQIGAKCLIFQTELGPIPVTRCDQWYAFSHQVYSAFKQQAQHIFKSEKYLA